jgi:2-dehydro-3-deoxygalactonokinase
MNITAEWIGVDRTAVGIRAWAMRGAEVLQQAHSDDHQGPVPQGGFLPAFLQIAEGWIGAHPTPVILSGFDDAQAARIAQDYAPVPAKPLARHPVPVDLGDRRLTGFSVPGLKQTAPPDLMHGDAVRIAGFLSLNTGWDGVLCLPGRHTRWAQISAGEVVSFQTYMTPELIFLMQAHSVLQDTAHDAGWNEAEFEDAVNDALSRPERLAARLYALHAGQIMNQLSPDAGRARLSGYMIGAELAAARPYWLGQELAIIGANPIAQQYSSALALQGATATLADDAHMTIKGLTVAWRSLAAPPSKA